MPRDAAWREPLSDPIATSRAWTWTIRICGGLIFALCMWLFFTATFLIF